jgi:uncharacterized protein involved in exopolysaccharide biosynthesis
MPSSRRRAEEAGLSEYLAIVMRHRLLIAGVCAVSLLVAFVVTLRTPRWYDSSATILVPKEAGPAGILGGLAATAWRRTATCSSASSRAAVSRKRWSTSSG